MTEPNHLKNGSRTVLVDQDGVMANYEEPNNDILRHFFPRIDVIKDREEFYFSDTYSDYPAAVSKIENVTRVPGFFRGFDPIEGAVHGWQRILDAGYTPRVCSSPLENHPTVIEEKEDWLEEHFVPKFGYWVIDTAIFNRDKSGYDAIAIIDDRPTLRNIEKASWQHIVFSQSYNMSVDTDYRLNGWHDTSLEPLLERAEERYLR